MSGTGYATHGTEGLRRMPARTSVSRLAPFDSWRRDQFKGRKLPQAPGLFALLPRPAPVRGDALSAAKCIPVNGLAGANHLGIQAVSCRSEHCATDPIGFVTVGDRDYSPA